MANINQNERYLANPWGGQAISQLQQPQVDDDIEVVYDDGGDYRGPNANSGQPQSSGGITNKLQSLAGIPIPKLMTNSPPLRNDKNSLLDISPLETNLTFKVDEFEMIGRQTLDWYGFKLYPSVSMFQSWFLRYVEHIRAYNSRLCNCVEQIERDYKQTNIIIEDQHSQQHTQSRKPLYYGTDYLSIVFAKPKPTNVNLFGGIAFGPSETTIESRMKTVTSSLQQVLKEPSNGGLSVNNSAIPKPSGQPRDRNEEIAFRDKWNPINCDIPFGVFVRHVQWRMETHPKKCPLPHFDIDIFRLRYVEYMAQVEKNEHSLLLAVLTAYGDTISKFPIRVMELLKKAKVFHTGSSAHKTDFGNHGTKAYISIGPIPDSEIALPVKTGIPSAPPLLPCTSARPLLPLPDPQPLLNPGYSTARMAMPESHQMMMTDTNTVGFPGRNPNSMNPQPLIPRNPVPLLPLPAPVPLFAPNQNQYQNPDYGYGNAPDSDYNQNQGYDDNFGYNGLNSSFQNAPRTNFGKSFMDPEVESLSAIANDPTKVLRNPINPVSSKKKKNFGGNSNAIPIGSQRPMPYSDNNQQRLFPPQSSRPSNVPGLMNSNFDPPGPQRLMDSDFGPPEREPQGNFGRHWPPPKEQRMTNSNFGPPEPQELMNSNFGRPEPQRLMNSNFGPREPQGLMNLNVDPQGQGNQNFNRRASQMSSNSNYNGPPVPPRAAPVPLLPSPGTGYQRNPQINSQSQYSTQTQQPYNSRNSAISVNGALNNNNSDNQLPPQMKNLIQAATEYTRRPENQEERNPDRGRISFEMPFDIWKVACERSRSNIHNQLSNAPLRRLTEEEYRMWYARYLYHVETNFDNFLQGIISGFPPPNYPKEIRDMITHRQLIEEGKCPPIKNNFRRRNEEVNENFSNQPSLVDYGDDDDYEGEEEIDYPSHSQPVVFDYGHSTQGLRQPQGQYQYEDENDTGEYDYVEQQEQYEGHNPPNPSRNTFSNSNFQNAVSRNPRGLPQPQKRSQAHDPRAQYRKHFRV